MNIRRSIVRTIQMQESASSLYYYDYYGSATGINNRVPICPACRLPVGKFDGRTDLGTKRCECLKPLNSRMSESDEVEKVPSRRGLFRRLGQEIVKAPVTHALAQQAASHLIQKAIASPPSLFQGLPQQLRSMPHVAMGYGYKHVGSEGGIHKFSHPDGSTLEINQNELVGTGYEKGHTGRVWSHKTKDDTTSYHHSHGTPLASLDNHLDATHNPKPEWFDHKSLTPATFANTDFDASVGENWDSIRNEDPESHEGGLSPHHYMVHMDRGALSPGSNYAIAGGDHAHGALSHPNFRSVMRQAGLAHMIPHATNVGYDDISLPFKHQNDAEEAAEILRHHVGATPAYTREYGDDGVKVDHYYGFDPC